VSRIDGLLCGFSFLSGLHMLLLIRVSDTDTLSMNAKAADYSVIREESVCSEKCS